MNAVRPDSDVVADSVINAGTVPSSVCPGDSMRAPDATGHTEGPQRATGRGPEGAESTQV